MNLFLDLLDCGSRLFIVDSYAYQLAACFLKPQYFSYSSLHISGFGCTHALNRNLVVSPNNEPANIDRTGLVSQEHDFSPP